MGDVGDGNSVGTSRSASQRLVTAAKHWALAEAAGGCTHDLTERCWEITCNKADKSTHLQSQHNLFWKKLFPKQKFSPLLETCGNRRFTLEEITPKPLNELSPSRLRLVNLSPRYCRAFLAMKATPNLITSILQSPFNTLHGPSPQDNLEAGCNASKPSTPQKYIFKKKHPFPCAYGARNNWSRILETGPTLIFSHHLNQKLPSNSQVKPRPRVTSLNSSSTWR